MGPRVPAPPGAKAFAGALFKSSERLGRVARLGQDSIGPGGGRGQAEGWRRAEARVSDGGLPLFAVGKPRVELSPGVEGLAGPDPEA